MQGHTAVRRETIQIQVCRVSKSTCNHSAILLPLTQNMDLGKDLGPGVARLHWTVRSREQVIASAAAPSAEFGTK